MTNDCTACAEYLVRRHELAVARYFLSDLGLALIASEDAGLSGSIQALLRVIFGYQPDIKTVCTIGQLLDGLAEASPGLVIINDGIVSGKQHVRMEQLKWNHLKWNHSDMLFAGLMLRTI